MRKLSTIAAVFSLILSGSAFSETGTITFNGAVLDAGCSLKTPGDITVTLPSVYKNDLKTVGQRAAPTRFSIELNCPADNKASGIIFDASAANANNTVIKANGRTDVGIQLTDTKSSEEVILRQVIPLTLNEGDNTLEYFARYEALTANVTAGSVTAVSTFTIVYN